jgi:hypothetical protein
MRDDLYNEIAKVAYDLHEKRGRKHGHDMEDWLEAERIILTRYEKGPEKARSKRSSKDTTKKKKK